MLVMNLVFVTLECYVYSTFWFTLNKYKINNKNNKKKSWKLKFDSAG